MCRRRPAMRVEQASVGVHELLIRYRWRLLRRLVVLLGLIFRRAVCRGHTVRCLQGEPSSAGGIGCYSSRAGRCRVRVRRQLALSDVLGGAGPGLRPLRRLSVYWRVSALGRGQGDAPRGPLCSRSGEVSLIGGVGRTAVCPPGAWAPRPCCVGLRRLSSEAGRGCRFGGIL